MWALETGDELLIGEPNNHFEIGWQAPYTLLVAGGIGITPILGMALQLAQRGAPLRMLYAARCADELIYRDTLQTPACASTSTPRSPHCRAAANWRCAVR